MSIICIAKGTATIALGKYHTEPCKTWKKSHAFRVRIC